MGLMASIEAELPSMQSRRDFFTFAFARKVRGRGGQPPKRPNIDHSPASPQPPGNGGFKLSRRSLIVGGGVLTTGAIVAAITKPWEQLYYPTTDLDKQRLNTELDELPNSTVKSLLTARIKPLFGPHPPKSINYEGLEIKIAKSKVVSKTVNINEVRGLYSPRDSSFVTLEPLYPTKETTIRIPYLGLLLDSERSDIPVGNLAVDNTPLIDIVFPTDKPFYEGFSHVITITTPDPSVIEPEYRNLYRNFEKFAYVKEACSLLAIDILVEEIVKKMGNLGLNPTIEARTINGTRKQAEALAQSLSIINNAQGRLAAVIDLAGYLLAFKVLEGTKVDDPNNMDQGLLKLRPNMQAVNLGTSAQDILYNSFRWALTTPGSDKLLVHIGNINNIP